MCLGKDMEKHYAEEYNDHTRRQEEHIKRLEAEGRSKTLLIDSLTAEVEALRRERGPERVWLYGLIYGLIISVAYIHTQNQQTQNQQTEVSMSPVVKIGSVPPIKVLNHSDFKIFSAFISRTDLTLIISFSAVTNWLNGPFYTSVIVRVQDPTTTYDQRVNVTFTPTDVENRYFSESKELIDVRKFNSAKLQAGIINIEITSPKLQSGINITGGIGTITSDAGGIIFITVSYVRSCYSDGGDGADKITVTVYTHGRDGGYLLHNYKFVLRGKGYPLIAFFDIALRVLATPTSNFCFPSSRKHYTPQKCA